MDKQSMTPEEMIAKIELLEAQLKDQGESYTDFIDRIWSIVLPWEKPGDWEYPGQALRMVETEVNKLRAEIEQAAADEFALTQPRTERVKGQFSGKIIRPEFPGIEE